MWLQCLTRLAAVVHTVYRIVLRVFPRATWCASESTSTVKERAGQVEVFGESKSPVSVAIRLQSSEVRVTLRQNRVLVAWVKGLLLPLCPNINGTALTECMWQKKKAFLHYYDCAVFSSACSWPDWPICSRNGWNVRTAWTASRSKLGGGVAKSYLFGGCFRNRSLFLKQLPSLHCIYLGMSESKSYKHLCNSTANRFFMSCVPSLRERYIPEFSTHPEWLFLLYRFYLCLSDVILIVYIKLI